MLGRVHLFPKVTTSRKKLINHICSVFTEEDLLDKKEDLIKHISGRINECTCFGHYFMGMIFVEKLSPYVILHELIHHVSAFMRGLTQSKIWYNLDYTLDGLDIFIFRKH